MKKKNSTKKMISVHKVEKNKNSTLNLRLKNTNEWDLPFFLLNLVFPLLDSNWNYKHIKFNSTQLTQIHLWKKYDLLWKVSIRPDEQQHLPGNMGNVYAFKMYSGVQCSWLYFNELQLKFQKPTQHLLDVTIRGWKCSTDIVWSNMTIATNYTKDVTS